MAEKTNYAEMTDKDVEKHLIESFMNGKPMDFATMAPEMKQRFTDYVMSSETKSPGPIPGAATAQNIGMSQMNAPNMSQPQQMSLGGLMGMATSGIQRVTPGRRKGLMENF